MKGLKKLYLHNSIFRFMISYAGVLLVPLLVCLLSYQFTFKTVKEEIKENNLSMITRSKNLIDGQVKTISSLMMQTADNHKVIKFADKKAVESSKFYSEASDVISELAYIFKYTNTDIFNDIYLYIDNTSYIVTRYDLYKSDLYYKMVLDEDIDYEAWITQLMDKEKPQRYIATDTQIKCIQRVPLRTNRDIEGAVVCNISKQDIKNYLTNVAVEEGANLFITDKSGELLLQLSQEGKMPVLDPDNKEEVFTQTIDGVENTIFRLASSETGWVYTLVLPEKVIMHKLTNLKNTITSLFLLAVAIGVVISYYMANRSGKPIEEVKKQLIDMKQEMDIPVEEITSTSSLSGTLTKIMSQKQMLSDEIQKQRPYLESALFQKLIKGEFISDKEIQYICQRTHVNLNAHAYWVINCRFFGNNDMFNLDEQTLEDVNLLKILLKESIHQYMNREMYFYDLDQLTVTIILPKSDLEYKNIEESINKVNEQMQKEYQVTPAWGISSECTNLLQLWRAFEEAKSALKSGIESGNNNLIEYVAVEMDQMTYYYPLVVEKQLNTYTKDGNLEGIRKLWDMVYTENFINRTLEQGTIDKLYLEIKGTFLKLIKKVDTEVHIDYIDEYMVSKKEEDIKKCFEQIINICCEISSTYSQQKKFQQSKLIHRIMNYINEQYPNPNLGLGMIATNFSISEGYVSSLFKEQAGVNFAEYVETQRINKACELLQTTDMNINDISEKVGYNSVQSFRRAFKRLHSFSPSELRKNKN